MITTIILSTGTLIISVCFLIWLWNKKKYAHFPGPLNLPIIGNLYLKTTPKDFTMPKKNNDQNLDDIIYFIHRSLLVYSHTGANALERGEDKIPLILGGDFNVNFGSDDSLPLINFLRETFGLLINNDPKESTTKSGTTIDAVFTRYIENIESRTYISYFSYHKPLISVLPIEAPTDNSTGMIDLSWKFSKIYGRMYVMFMGPFKPFIILEDADDFEMIFTKGKQKGMLYFLFEPWLGQGLFTNKGQDWHQKRKWITPAFHFKILETYVDIFTKKAESFCEELEKFVGDENVEISKKLGLCSLEIMIESAMRLNYSKKDKNTAEFMNAIKRNLKSMVLRAIEPLHHIDFFYYLTPTGRKFYKDTKIIKNYTLQIIEKRKEERKIIKIEKSSNEDVNYFKKKAAFLDLLLDIQEENETFTNENIRDEVATFLFAGHDTTTAAINFTLFSIAKHQNVQDKIVEELDEIFGESTRQTTFADLSQMNYLERVIKESLRLYPSAHLIMRKADEDIYLKGNILVPKGTEIILNIERLGKNEKYWPNPNKFDPDRFLPENSSNRHPYAFLAFSAGPRNCIGQKFAMLEMKTLISTILRKFHLRDVGHKVELSTEMILKSENGIYIRIDERK